MKSLILQFSVIISLLISSCSSSDDSNLNESNDPVNFSVDQLETEIRFLEQDFAVIDLNVDTQGFSVQDRRILYRPEGTTNFLSVSPGNQMNDLIRGKNYEYKAQVTVDATLFETPLRIFTTKGFSDIDSFYADVDVLHKTYSFFNQDGAANMDEAVTPFKLYLKVDTDSLEINTIVRDNPHLVRFDIDDLDKQQFFENAVGDDYTAVKSFTIVIQSGDYQTEVTPLFNIIYDGIESSRWSIFNKVPRVSGHSQIASSCNEDGPRPEIITFSGFFYGGDENFDFFEDQNIADNYNLKIENVADPSISQVYYPADEEENVTINCDFQGQRRFRTSINGQYGFHHYLLMRVRFDPILLPPGDYNVTFVAEKDNVAFFSEPYVMNLL